MDAIEPNVMALLAFSLFAGVASVGFYVLTGVFPLETRPDLTAKPLGIALVLFDLLLLAILVAGSLAYAIEHLRWTSLIIVSASALLFAPGLFNVWPQRWRDGVAGLLTILVCFGGSLALLRHLGPVFGF